MKTKADAKKVLKFCYSVRNFDAETWFRRPPIMKDICCQCCCECSVRSTLVWVWPELEKFVDKLEDL